MASTADASRGKNYTNRLRGFAMAVAAGGSYANNLHLSPDR